MARVGEGKPDTSLREAADDTDGHEDQAHGRVRWFHEQGHRQRDSQARIKQRASKKAESLGTRLFQKGLVFIDNPHMALTAHQVSDLTVAHKMILDVAHSNLDVRKKIRPKVLNKPSERLETPEPDEPKAVKLPSLSDGALPALSDKIRDAMHRARILNEDRKRSESVLMPPSCYDLEDIAPDELYNMRMELQREQLQLGPRISTLAAQKMSGGSEATGQRFAAGEHDTAVKQLEHAFKSATCHWCRQRTSWCGWCKIPELIKSHHGAPYASEGFHSNERSPQKIAMGLLGGLGIGGKGLSQSTQSENPQIPQSKKNLKIRRTMSKGPVDPSTRSVSSLGRLEGHSEFPAVKRQTATQHKKAKKFTQKKDRRGALIDVAEEQRRKVLQVLSERKPVSFSLLEDNDLDELSYRVIVRELQPGEEVMKYADDCSPALLHCPDTEEGWPVLAMGSAFFIVMHGILDVITEYSEKGEPMTRGKMTRGCVFGEVLPCWVQCRRAGRGDAGCARAPGLLGSRSQ